MSEFAGILEENANAMAKAMRDDINTMVIEYYQEHREEGFCDHWPVYEDGRVDEPDATHHEIAHDELESHFLYGINGAQDVALREMFIRRMNALVSW